MKRLCMLVVFAAIVVGASPPSSNASQKHRRSIKLNGNTPAQLDSVEQFKEAFQNNAGKVRLVALVSPT